MGLDFPNEPRPGEPLDASWGVKVVRALRALQWKSSPSIEVTTLGYGTTGRVKRGGAGATEILRTMFVSDVSSTEIEVSPGRIANIKPTLGGEELDADPAPKLAITTTSVVYVRGDFDEDGVPTAFVILAAAEVPDDTEEQGHKVLADVVCEDNKIVAVHPVAWNLTEVQKCGALTYLWGGFGGEG